MSADRPVSPAPDTVTDEMVRVAAEAIEDVAIARIGRDLGTLHRDEIVRAGLEAVVPLIRAQVVAEQEAYEPFVAGPGERDVIDMGFLSLPAEIQAEAEQVAAARPTVAVDPADLRLVLDQDTAHYHQRPGVWDDDNPPERAGKPCVECAARERLRAALDGGDDRG